MLTNSKPDVWKILKTDSSNYVNSRIFFQLDHEKLLYIVAFFSKNLNPIRCNYKIYNEKLLAIIRYFEKQKPELESITIPVKVIADYKI